MKLYIARDDNGDLYLYSVKPTKSISDGCWYDTESGLSIYLETNKFPEVKWEDEEPTEAELTIKKKI